MYTWNPPQKSQAKMKTNFAFPLPLLPYFYPVFIWFYCFFFSSLLLHLFFRISLHVQRTFSPFRFCASQGQQLPLYGRCRRGQTSSPQSRLVCQATPCGPFDMYVFVQYINTSLYSLCSIYSDNRVSIYRSCDTRLSEEALVPIMKSSGMQQPISLIKLLWFADRGCLMALCLYERA